MTTISVTPLHILLSSQIHRIAAISTMSALMVLPGCGGGGSPDDGGDGDGDGGEDSSGLGGGGAAPTGGSSSGMGGDSPDVVETRDDEVVGPEGQPFLPEGIVFNHIGEGEAEFQIVASTLLQSSGIWDEPAWFVAAKNVGFTTVCLPALNFEFFNASGQSLVKDYAFMEAPMYMSYGNPRQCLGPGDVGMMRVTSPLQNLTLSEVQRIDYSEGGSLTLSAERIEDVTLSDLSIEPIYSEDLHLVGKLNNGLSSPIQYPSAAAFVVDSKGRPYALMEAIDLVTVQPGGAWEFSNLSFDEEIENFVVFVDYDFPFDL